MVPHNPELPPEANRDRSEPEEPLAESSSLDPDTLGAMLSADLGRPDSPIQDELLAEDPLTDNRPILPPANAPGEAVTDPADVPGAPSPENAQDNEPSRESDSPDRSAPMTQAELDAMVAHQETVARDGDDFDSLVAKAQTSLLGEAPASEIAASLPEEPPLTQADLDTLRTEPPPSTDMNNDDSPGQETPGAAIVAETGESRTESPPTAEDDGAALTQEDLDALIAAESAKPEAAGEAQPAEDDKAALTQEDLDALIAAEAVKPEAAGEAQPAEDDKTVLSQEDLDALIAAEAAKPEAAGEAQPAEDDKTVLSQEDLDALIASEGPDSENSTPESPPPPPPENEGPSADMDTRADDVALDQADIDALLTQSNDESVLDGKEPDAAVTPAAEADDDTALNQSGIDELISGLGTVADEPPAAPDETPDAEEDDEISQDMVDSIIASAVGTPTEEVGAENLAAAATTPEGDTPPLLSQADLDAVMEEAKDVQGRRDAQRREAIEAALAEASAPRSTAASPPPAPPGALGSFVREHALRLVACLAAALVAGFGTFTGLWLNMERIPDISRIHVATADALELAMERAKAHMSAGEYGAAAEALKEPIARAAPGPLRDDARYLWLEARCRGLRYRENSERIPELLGDIDRVVASARNHPRAPEALYWKAKLYEQDGLPRAAGDVYDDIISYYPNMARLDDVLMDASRLAMQLGEPLQAAQYARTLIKNFPGSRHYSQARLAYGDANEMAGSYEDARTLYLRVARAERDNKVGAEAFLRLGRLAYAQRSYADAAMQLETRLGTATTSEGNDKVYLLLAQCYRKLGRFEDARHALNDLLSFYPKSPEAPMALVELSQVQDDMGDGEAALATANRAAVTYPDDPRVLRNKGELLGRYGHPFSAAMALIDADAAGAADPEVLLMAARFFRVADMPGDARKAYEKLADDFGDTGQALTGNIELAQLLYQEGRVGGAVDRLENLAQATLGSPKRLNTLLALVDMYRDLGLNERVVELSREIVDKADQPEDLALAATALLSAGDVDKGMEALKRVDLARVKDQTAYRLLNEAGKSLLPLDPRQSLRYLEDACLAYPRSRTMADDQRLLKVYLINNRVADARRMVMEMKGHVDQTPSDAPYLIDAAIALGDHQYNQGAFRSAADTYKIAIDAASLAGNSAETPETDPRWAVFQRANALLELSDFQGSISLYGRIANSDTPWATEAEAKAEYARLQQKIRGGGSDVG